MKTCIYLAGTCTFALLLILVLLHAGVPQTQAAPPPYQPAGTIISTNVTTHTTWTKAGSPYTITVASIQVLAGITLTVEPGVEVISTQGFGGIQVPGTLVAIGTAAEPITFTSSTKSPGSWGYVNIGIGGRATLRRVIMEYGTPSTLTSYGMLWVDRGSATVSDSIFRFGGSNGIAASLDVTNSLQVTATSFISNGRAAVRISGVGIAGLPSDPQLRNLTATLNGLNAVEYSGVTLQGAHLWEQAGIPYATRGGLTVRGSLTLEPGVEVQSDSQFAVYGPMTALGTPSNPITFTGINKTPGAWWGINVAATPSTTGTLAMRNATIEYGGNINGANLYVDTGATVSVTQTTVRNSSRNGISVRGSGGVVQMTDLTVTNNGGHPLVLDGSTDPSVRGLSASGNLTSTILVGTGYGTGTGKHVWESLGIPYQSTWSVNIPASGSLEIEPGVEVRVAKNYAINVDGFLAAVGTVTQPITFTGAFTGASTPGWWAGVSVGILGHAMLGYCDIGYGGAAGQAMVQFRTSRNVMENCRIHHSAGDGIKAIGYGSVESLPVVRFNRIEHNAFGYRNGNGIFPPKSVDARWNWWGDASGPSHASNPGGLGDPVSDNVVFDPWLTVPSQNVNELELFLFGPDRFVPGRLETYSIGYSNRTTQTVENAVLLAALPSYAEYSDNSGGGTLWPQRRQLFWELGNIPPGGGGVVAFRVRFMWGLPDGIKDTVVVELGGTNLSLPAFDVQPYLDYVPVEVVSEQPLTLSQVQAERQGNPEFEQLYTLAVQEGYTMTLANRLILSAGEPITEVVLMRRQAPLGVTFVRRQGSGIHAVVVDTDNYLVRTGGATLRFNFQTDEWEIVAGGVALSQDPDATAFTYGDCMKNCVMKLAPKAAVKLLFKSVSAIFKAYDCYKAVTTGDELQWVKCAQIIKKVPGVGEGIDLGKCNSDCKQNPSSHYCTADLRFCDTDGFPYGIFGIHSISTCRCITDPATGRDGQYAACTSIPCAICEKCVDTGAGPMCIVNSPAGVPPLVAAPVRQTAVARNPDSMCSECVRAKDPNAKYGPSGDVLPGQWMTYTITYENEGAGEAYDVFVVDKLSEYLDASTLTVLGGGDYVAASRTLFWSVGQLAPKGQPGSTGVVSFTVRLKPDLPNGTAIVNQAVVHFPTVPEETPTNAVVNLIQPLVALPQSLETNAGEPIAIQLQGIEPLGAPLTYQLVELPQNGELSGAVPNLVYTPTNNFAAMDRLRFTVSNALTTSRPAEVQILVHPSPSDVTPPQVIRTSPASGAVINTIVATPRFTDTLGPLYLPAIEIDFSEAISETTVTTGTIQVKDGARTVAIRVAYDGLTNQAVAFLREPLLPGHQYTVTVTTGVRDSRGNPLASNFAWSFRAAGASLFLPMIRR